MASRKKTKKSAKKQTRTPVKESKRGSKKRTPVGKKTKTKKKRKYTPRKPKINKQKIRTAKEIKEARKRSYKPDRMPLTIKEQRAANKFKRASVKIVASLKKLATKIECDVKAIENASSKIHFLRAMRSTILGEPHVIWCPEKRHYTDIIICNFICPTPCNAFKSGRHICKMFRCPDDKIYMCEETGKRCTAYEAYSQFSEKYIAAYQPLYELREELKSLSAIKIPEKKNRRRRKNKTK